MPRAPRPRRPGKKANKSKIPLSATEKTLIESLKEAAKKAVLSPEEQAALARAEERKDQRKADDEKLAKAAQKMEADAEKAKAMDKLILAEDSPHAIKIYYELRKKGIKINTTQVEARIAYLHALGKLKTDEPVGVRKRRIRSKLINTIIMQEANRGEKYSARAQKRLKQRFGIEMTSKQITARAGAIKFKERGMKSVYPYLQKHPNASLEQIEQQLPFPLKSRKEFIKKNADKIKTIMARRKIPAMEKKPLNAFEEYFLRHKHPMTKVPRFTIDKDSGEIIPLWQRMGKALKEKERNR